MFIPQPYLNRFVCSLLHNPLRMPSVMWTACKETVCESVCEYTGVYVYVCDSVCMRQRVTLEKRVLFDSLICKYVFIRFFDNVLYNYVKEKDVHKILDKVSTGILIYLYNSRALHSLIVKI